MRTIYHILFILILSSCMSLPQGVEESLKMAGKNRSELKKVLRYYSRNDADSLKFQAACFLIDHMKWHNAGKPITYLDPDFQKTYQKIDHLFNILSEGVTVQEMTSAEMKKIFSQKKKVMKALFDTAYTETQTLPSATPDLQYLKADFLISHIDNAFKVRETSPYASHLTFDDFCNYVLPYRSCEFPRFNNGKELNEMFSRYINHPTATTMNDQLRWYNAYVRQMQSYYGKAPIKGQTGIFDLFFYHKHDCVGIASHGINVLRACGLPTAVDYNTAHRDFKDRHFHCSILDTTGQWLSFNAETSVPGEFNYKYYMVVNVLRSMYSAQKDSPYMLKSKEEVLPGIFRTPCLRDVTSCHKEVKKVTLPFQIPTSNNLAYLYVFQVNNMGIAPATWGVINHEKKEVVFENVLPRILYIPVYLDDDQVEYFDSPFWITKDSKEPAGYKIHPLEELTDTTTSVSNLVLTRKFPRKPGMLKIAQQMVGGQFHGANKADFSDARLLYTITTPPEAYIQEFKIAKPGNYKYYRYSAPDEFPNSNVSILEFLTSPGYGYSDTAASTPLPVMRPLKQIPVNPYVKLLDTLPERMKKAPQYDGKMLTSSGKQKMITLTLKDRRVVKAIRFAPLNADNGITPGNHYELMYWDKGWKNHYIEKAHDHYVEFKNVPSNRLYWLRNIDQGSEELPFIVTNGVQQFLYYDIVK